MSNVIRQIARDDEFGTQSIRIIMTSNDRGAQGPQGEPGEAATIEAGQAYSVEPGQSPAVMNTGTPNAAVFDFYIPKGEKGDRGEPGPAGADEWGEITGNIADQTDLQNALNGKQNKLTAGSNITISGNTISATNTTYTAGNGLNLNHGEFSVNTGTIQEKLTAGTNVDITGNTISATDTTYTAGAGLDLNGTEFSVDTDTIQSKLTAGSNVQINGNTISATDTTYTAGNAITIDSGNNNAINAAINPADFFTSTESKITGTGTSVTLTPTTGLPLSSVQLKGDTTQQTYSGQNLYNFTDTFAVSDGVTVDSDGWITITYDNSGGSSTVYKNYYTNPIPQLVASTEYDIYLEVKNVSGNARLNLVDNSANSNNGSQFAVDVIPFFNTLSNNSVYKYTSTTKSDISNAKTSIRTYGQFLAGNSGTITFRITVTEHSSATANDFAYEPYVGGVPAPNPEYPQEVQVVTGRQVVDVYNKNLFNYDNASQGYLGGSGQIVSNSTAMTSEYIEVDSSTAYTASANTTYRYIGIGEYTANKDYIQKTQENTSSLTITTSATTKYIRVFYNQSTNVSKQTLVTTEAQIEKGSTATPYQSHQSYEVNLGKNLYNLNNTLENRYLGSNGGWQTDNNNTYNNFEISVEPGSSIAISFASRVNAAIRAGEFTGNGTFITRTVIAGGGSATSPQIFTLQNNTKKVIFSIDQSGTNYYTDLQIELGSTATTYAPYISHFGKNLLGNLVSAGTNNGLTTVVNADGSLSVSGTATSTYATLTTAASVDIANGMAMTFSVKSNPSVTVGVILYNTGYTNRQEMNIGTSARSVSVTTNSAKTLAVVWCSGLTANTSYNFKIEELQLEQSSTATPYQPFIGGQLELCKIGTYQDYIYKSGSDWYVHKESGKVVYNGSEDWGYASTFPRASILKPSDIGSVYQDQATTTKCSHFIAGNSGDSSQNNVYNIGTTNIFFKSSSIMSTLDGWKTWLTSNPVTFYYGLATHTDIQITDSSVVAQLEALLAANSYDPTTIFTASSEYLPAVLSVSTLRKSLAGVLEAIRRQ